MFETNLKRKSKFFILFSCFVLIVNKLYCDSGIEVNES